MNFWAPHFDWGISVPLCCAQPIHTIETSAGKGGFGELFCMFSWVLRYCFHVGFVALWRPNEEPKGHVSTYFRNKTMSASKGEGAATPTFSILRIPSRMGRSVQKQILAWNSEVSWSGQNRLWKVRGCTEMFFGWKCVFSVPWSSRGVPGSSGADGFSMFISYQEFRGVPGRFP